MQPDFSARYSFDDATGNSETGTHHGTAVSTAAFTEAVVGGVYKGLEFNGVDSRVDLHNLDVAGGALTLAAWVKYRSFSGYSDSRIVSKATGTSQSDHIFMLSGVSTNGAPVLRFRLRTDDGLGTGQVVASGGGLVVGQWVHVAAVYDGATMAVYQDGVLLGSTEKTGCLHTDSSVGTEIGRNPDGARPFDGFMDDVFIMNRAVDASELVDMMGGRFIPSVPTPQPPVTPSPSTLVPDTPVPSTLAPETPAPSTLSPPTPAPSTLTPASPCMQPDFSARYSFDDATGNSETGTHHGTAVSTAAFTEAVVGGVYKGLEFNGVDSRVDLHNLDVAGGALTLTAWVKYRSFSGYSDSRIVSKATGTSQSDHIFMLSGVSTNGAPVLRFRLRTDDGLGTGQVVASGGGLVVGQWVHVAAVYDGATMAVYQDGVLVGSAEKTGCLHTDSSVGTEIGRNPDGARPFDGFMDDVFIMNRAVDASELVDMMGGRFIPSVPTPQPPVTPSPPTTASPPTTPAPPTPAPMVQAEPHMRIMYNGWSTMWNSLADQNSAGVTNPPAEHNPSLHHLVGQMYAANGFTDYSSDFEFLPQGSQYINGAAAMNNIATTTATAAVLSIYGGTSGILADPSVADAAGGWVDRMVSAVQAAEARGIVTIVYQAWGSATSHDVYHNAKLNTDSLLAKHSVLIVRNGEIVEALGKIDVAYVTNTDSGGKYHPPVTHLYSGDTSDNFHGSYAMNYINALSTFKCLTGISAANNQFVIPSGGNAGVQYGMTAQFIQDIKTTVDALQVDTLQG